MVMREIFLGKHVMNKLSWWFRGEWRCPRGVCHPGWMWLIESPQNLSDGPCAAPGIRPGAPGTKVLGSNWESGGEEATQLPDHLKMIILVIFKEHQEIAKLFYLVFIFNWYGECP